MPSEEEPSLSGTLRKMAETHAASKQTDSEMEMEPMIGEPQRPTPKKPALWSSQGVEAARDSWKQHRSPASKSEAAQPTAGPAGYGSMGESVSVGELEQPSFSDDLEAGEDPEVVRLKEKMEEFCHRDPSLESLGDEIHNLPATPAQLRQLHNLFLEPLHEVNVHHYQMVVLDKVLSLSIMALGTVVPMLHLMGFASGQAAMVGSMIPLLQGINLHYKPNKKLAKLEQQKAACLTEAHHFLSLSGDYHEHDDHQSALKHFLETSHHHLQGKKPGKKKKKEESEEGADDGKKSKDGKK